MTLSEFYDVLDKHDWFYQMSDDHSVYSRGYKAAQEILSHTRESEAHQNLFKEYADFVFSGPFFGNERKQKPKRPKEG